MSEEKQSKELANESELAKATETIRSLFDGLVPPENVTIIDVLGDKHTVSGTVSARQQIQILRLVEEVKDIELNFNLEGEINIVNVVLGLSSNEKVLSALGKCFDIAYPQLVRQVAFDAGEAGLENNDALDLFPIEEIVASIAPLFIRLAQRAVSAFKKVQS